MSNFESNASAIPAARPRVTVKTVTSLAMLVALTYLAMVFSKVLPQFNGFLQFEIKGTVVAIGGFQARHSRKIVKEQKVFIKELMARTLAS